MKKYALIFAVILSATSCRIFQMDPFEPTHHTGRYIKNNTQKTIIITTRDFTSKQRLDPGDSICVFGFNPPQKWGTPSFDTHYDWQDENGNGQKQYVAISSIDGELLKTWVYASENMQGERFFEERSWRFYIIDGSVINWGNEELYVWVFDLLPEDIAPEVES